MTRVLLVDDERTYIDSLAKVLRRRGFEVATSYDGRSALALFDAQEPDVVLLDLRMPGQDGIATLAEIRKLDQSTPVLLLTGHADIERAAAALRGGATDILLKPCPIEELISAVENAAERKRLGGEAPPG
ncbi:MAG: response regulator [Acidobacteriota bacterium]